MFIYFGLFLIGLSTVIVKAEQENPDAGKFRFFKFKNKYFESRRDLDQVVVTSGG